MPSPLEKAHGEWLRHWYVRLLVFSLLALAVEALIRVVTGPGFRVPVGAVVHGIAAVFSIAISNVAADRVGLVTQREFVVFNHGTIFLLVNGVTAIVLGVVEAWLVPLGNQ